MSFHEAQTVWTSTVLCIISPRLPTAEGTRERERMSVCARQLQRPGLGAELCEGVVPLQRPIGQRRDGDGPRSRVRRPAPSHHAAVHSAPSTHEKSTRRRLPLHHGLAAGTALQCELSYVCVLICFCRSDRKQCECHHARAPRPVRVPPPGPLLPPSHVFPSFPIPSPFAPAPTRPAPLPSGPRQCTNRLFVKLLSFHPAHRRLKVS